jgi:histidine phosphotransferase ChpT
MQVDLKVVQLLSSRLCHDLVGPAGAVHNGIELFEEIGPGGAGAGAGALKIVATSAEQLLARLAFFRMAFGLGGLSGRHHPLAEARDMTQAFLEGRRITLDWPPEIVTNMGQAITAPTVKLLLNMVLVAIDGLPRGGVLTVSLVSLCNPQDEPAIGMTVKAFGAGACLKKDLQLALSSQSLSQVEQGLSAHNVHGFFCQRLAEEQLSKIEFCMAQDTVQLTALIPPSA